MATFKEFLIEMDVDFNHLIATPAGGGFQLVDIEIKPIEFLTLAEQDYEKGGMAALINCITNAKRAITCQMDQLILSFGFNPYSWNIPKKLECLQRLGLLTPAILRKVSSTRNLLEHQYEKPTMEEVENGLDIATLFVMSNVALFNPFGDELEFGVDSTWNEETKEFDVALYIGLESNKNKVAYSCTIREKEKIKGEYDIINSDPLFFGFVKLAVSFELKYKIDEAFENINRLYMQS